jgi:hypothetical protein
MAEFLRELGQQGFYMPNANLKCRKCGERKPRETMLKVPLGAFCDVVCASEYGKDKSQRGREKTDRRIHRAQKQSLKTAGDHIREAQAAVNAFIRIRDYGKPCISCGNIPAQKFGGTVDAGHYRSRGAAGHLRFNVFNIHGQCVKCNRFNSGNAVDYRINLIDKIGLERVERLEQDNNPRKFNIEYLQRVKRIFNKRTRIYKKLKGL